MLTLLPYITCHCCQTIAYAFSLVIQCMCYSRSDPMTQGSAEQVYEKLYDGYSKRVRGST